MALLAMSGAASGPGIALVAGQSGVAKIGTPCPLQQIATHGREIAHLSAGARKDGIANQGMTTVTGTSTTASPLDAQLDAMMGDAPVCDVCGHITVRNGACYKCLNCGNSMGCS